MYENFQNSQDEISFHRSNCLTSEYRGHWDLHAEIQKDAQIFSTSNVIVLRSMNCPMNVSMSRNNFEKCCNPRIDSYFVGIRGY